MNFENRLLNNRFLLLRSVLSIIWAVYVSMRLVNFGGTIPKSGDTYILYNTVNSGLVYMFSIVGLLGVWASLSSHYMPRLKTGVLIAMLMMWTALAVFFIFKDITVTGSVTFSTILICSVAISILIELWVGDSA